MSAVTDIPPILAHLVRSKAQTQPDFEVLTFVDIAPDGNFVDEVRTYRALWQQACVMARFLQGKGVKPGDRFAIIMQNHPEFVEAMIAASILGAVFVPIDPRTKGDKLIYMLDFAECTGAIVADYALPNLADVLPRVPRLTWIATLGKAAGASADPRVFRLDVARNGDAWEMPILSNDPDATMQLLYTSGTTGDPKAIIATHRRFVEGGMLGLMLGLKPEDRLYTGLSLTHANAQLITLGIALQMGMRAVISRKFTKSRLWDITRWYGCTVFNLLGGMTVELYSQPPGKHDAHNPVRVVLSAGMPSALWEAFAKRFGVQVFEFYGAAEGGLTLNPPGVGPVGSVGKPPPNLELAILDDDDRPLPARAEGEICFRPAAGASPIVRYLKNDDASKKKTASGWLHSGDLGHVDADGWLYFHSRKGDEIRRNGEFISPGFVEKAIAEHPQVADVFVYGIPSRSGAPGEKDVVAAIVPGERGLFDVTSVFAHCRRVLERSAVPSFLQVVTEIPKTASEKPQERFLREQLTSGALNIFAAEDAAAA
ncbi:MAG: AMP-binding protein [Micropepsaceae bacterium]